MSYLHRDGKIVDDGYHWWLDWLDIIVKDKFPDKKYIIKTVDLFANGSSDYIADAFSDNFIKEHIREFDIILYPDCEGKWSTNTNNDIDDIIINYTILISNTMNMLKPNGYGIYSKLKYDENNNHINYLISNLIEFGYNIEFIPYGDKKYTINTITDPDTIETRPNKIPNTIIIKQMN